jgi:GH25 family lysozyme M1 (1,4-beta-N-acetylmuramidase)
MIFGIDTASVANSGVTIDWKKVRAAGASFAFHRSNWGDVVDPTFKKNFPRMLDAGLVSMPYMFLRHPGPKGLGPSIEAQCEALSRAVSAAGGMTSGVPVLDVEFPGKGRADTGLSADQLMGRVVAAAEIIRDQFGSLILYTSARVMREDLNDIPFPEWMRDLPLWLARYYFKSGPYVMNADAFKDGKNSPPSPKGYDDNSWWLHQLQGDASGFPGCGSSNVDMNRFNPLTKGDKGARVRWMQRRLGVRVDGNFGAATESALMVFQRQWNLVADGIVGPRTFAELCTHNV